MANRSNHYEAALEQYLRDHRVTYVAVDEAKRSMMAEASLKSLDFIVSSPLGGTWLIDVKGRRFPAGRQQQYWRNWTTRDDLHSLAAWQELFGERSQALLLFAFQVVGRRAPLPPAQLYWHRESVYGFVGMRLEDYVPHARTISPKWDTLAISASTFRALAQPLDELLAESPRKPAPRLPLSQCQPVGHN